MYVKDVMTSKVHCVLPFTQYKQIWMAIFQSHSNAVPVVDKKGKLVGLVTRDDLLRPLYPKYQEVFETIESPADFESMEDHMKELEGLKASDVMQKRVIFTRDMTLVMRALSRMILRRVNQLPVLDEHNVVIGIVTKGDIFLSLFHKNFKPVSTKDSLIKQKVKRSKRNKRKS